MGITAEFLMSIICLVKKSRKKVKFVIYMTSGLVEMSKSVRKQQERR